MGGRAYINSESGTRRGTGSSARNLLFRTEYHGLEGNLRLRLNDRQNILYCRAFRRNRLALTGRYRIQRRYSPSNGATLLVNGVGDKNNSGDRAPTLAAMARGRTWAGLQRGERSSSLPYQTSCSDP